jgi:2-C-methyl-D-erythritol 4-phosphate cytidylyltransferase
VTVWAVVVAAGDATRYGSPKQYERLGDRRVLDWSLAAAAVACNGVVVVVPRGRGHRPEPIADTTVEGASTRPGSVRRGLAVVPTEADVVVVHDAARPLVTPALFRLTVEAVWAGADGAVCAVPVDDTVKRVEDRSVLETLDRRGLWAVQTPQAFRAHILHQAHRAHLLRTAHGGEPEATDDAALVEAVGGRVTVVEGDRRNLKLTRRGDLEVARALLGTMDRVP